MKTSKKLIKLIYIVVIVQLPFIFLIFLPDQPNAIWQVNLLNFIHNKLHITIGSNGPIPLFTVLVSIYVMLVYTAIMIVACISHFKKIGVGNRFQTEVYKLVNKSFVESKYTAWLKKYPIIKKIHNYLLHFLILWFSFWHLTNNNISFMSGRRAGLIGLAYQHRLGVIITEYLFQLLFIANVFLLLIYMIYSMNIIRGIGWGNDLNVNLNSITVKPYSIKKKKKNKRKR